MDQIPTQKIEEFKKEFDLIDRNGKGSISADDLKRVMTAVGEAVTDEDIKNMIEEADLNTDGVVDFPEFAKMMQQRRKQNALAEFQIFDKDGSGTVSAQELKGVLKKFDVDISDETLDGMIKEADQDGDGSINYAEFMKIMSNK